MSHYTDILALEERITGIAAELSELRTEIDRLTSEIRKMQSVVESMKSVIAKYIADRAIESPLDRASG